MKLIWKLLKLYKANNKLQFCKRNNVCTQKLNRIQNRYLNLKSNIYFCILIIKNKITFNNNYNKNMRIKKWGMLLKNI